MFSSSCVKGERPVALGRLADQAVGHHPREKLPADLSCVSMVSVELAKHVFQAHAVNANGKVIVARALRRRDVCP